MEPKPLEEQEEKTEQVDADRNAEQILLNLPRSSLSYSDRECIAQVYFGNRPATHQLVNSYIEHDQDKAYARQDYRRNLIAVEAAIKGLKLPFVRAEDKTSTDFYIGESIEKAIELRDAFKSSYSPERHRRIGNALGFPPTAVDAFVQRASGNEYAVVGRLDLPPEVSQSDVSAFLGMWLSRNNWPEEVAAIKKNMESLKMRMPELYALLIQRHNKMERN